VAITAIPSAIEHLFGQWEQVPGVALRGASRRAKTNNQLKPGREVPQMSRTYKDMPLRVHGIRRQEIDARRLARAVIELAAAGIEPKKTAQPKPASGSGSKTRRARPAGSGS